MSVQGFLAVEPKDLRFRADTKKQPPTVLYLRNSSNERVAFKVKTTAPKRYCVKPSADVVEPNGTMEVKVFIQHSKDLTPAVIADCRDKFLIQSTPVSPDWSIKADADGKAGDVFNKKDNTRLVEEKLKVTLEAPPAPPSPVQEVSETAELPSNSSPLVATRAAPAPAAAGATTYFPATVKSSGGGITGGGGSGGGGTDLITENRQLRERLAMADLRSSESGAKGGYKIMHLVAVALVCFLLGWLF